ncbi:MAG: hypothetical protein RMZ41_000555 [Nostoc sp. DedVER02]
MLIIHHSSESRWKSIWARSLALAVAEEVVVTIDFMKIGEIAADVTPQNFSNMLRSLFLKSCCNWI